MDGENLAVVAYVQPSTNCKVSMFEVVLSDTFHVCDLFINKAKGQSRASFYKNK